MPIPLLNSNGLLPDGTHECTVEEMTRTFGLQNPRREDMCGRLIEYFSDARRSRCPAVPYIGGSFVSAKDAPGDVDVALDCSFIDNWHKNPIIARLANQEAALSCFGIHIFVVPQLINSKSKDVRETFRRVGPIEAISLGIPPGTRKGLLRIKL